MRMRAERMGQVYVSPFGPIPPPPELLSANEDAWELFAACSSQLILGGMGGVAGVRHDSLPWRMDLLEISPGERYELDEKFRLIERVFVKFCNRDMKKSKDDRG